MKRNIQPNESRINAVLVILRISLVFYILKFVFELFRNSLWAKIRKGELISPNQRDWIELFEVISIAVQLTLFTLVIIFLTRWLYRSYKNLGQFRKLRNGEYMPVVSWFVPIYNWVGPFLIYTEIVLGYEDILVKNNFLRQNLRRVYLKNWWWFSFVIAQILWFISFGHDQYNFFSNALGTGFFLVANLLLLASLADVKIMENGIAEMKDVHYQQDDASDILDTDI